MTFMNKGANVKQFQLFKFINENCIDDHVVSKITIVLRRDKIEAPYYMNTKIKLSSCLDMPDNGIIHAMDLLSHNRMHNLTEDAYNEIKSLIMDKSEDNHYSDNITISPDGLKLKIVLIARNEDEFCELSDNYHELFDKIDGLLD